MAGIEEKWLADRGDALEDKGWIPVPVYLSGSSSIVLCRNWRDPLQPGQVLRLDEAEIIQRRREAAVLEVMES